VAPLAVAVEDAAEDGVLLAPESLHTENQTPWEHEKILL
jgi:hypothetical protein